MEMAQRKYIHTEKKLNLCEVKSRAGGNGSLGIRTYVAWYVHLYKQLFLTRC